jgi:L-threonine kinase
MKIKALCPASCGELIQGVVGDGEKLISLPINIFSEVTIEETRKGSLQKGKRKSIEALYKTFQYFGIPQRHLENLSLKIKSEIPIAKGMASSTADIAGTIIAAAGLLGKRLKNEELAKLCCEIEPTDSTIFARLTLFDHIKGRVIEEFEWSPDIKILVLELEDILDTQEFRKKDYGKVREENRKDIERAFSIFSEGCKKRDKKLLGKAVTMSSVANQKLIYKPMLSEIIDISYKCGAYGVNVAHSGTVIGILYDEHLVDIDRLKRMLWENEINKHYFKVYSVDMIKGGVRIMEE